MDAVDTEIAFLQRIFAKEENKAARDKFDFFAEKTSEIGLKRYVDTI
jgi:hypothetical protein